MRQVDKSDMKVVELYHSYIYIYIKYCVVFHIYIYIHNNYDISLNSYIVHLRIVVYC